MNRKLEPKPHIKNWYVIVIVVIIALFVIAVLSRIAELGKIGQLLEQASIGWLIVALVAQFLAFLFLGALYKSIVSISSKKEKTGKVSLWYFFKVNIAMVFADYAIPSFSASSNVLLYHATRKYAVHKERSSLVIAFNVFLNFTFFFLVFIAALFYLVVSGKYQRILFWPTIIFIILFVLINRILWTKAGERHFKLIFSKLLGKWPRAKKRFLRVVGDFYKAKKHVGAKDMSLFVIYTLFSYIFRIAAIGFIFLSLSYNINIGILAIGYVLATALALISYIRVGVYEGSMVFAYSTMGVPLSIAVAATLLYRVISFWIPFVIGFVLFRNIIKAKTKEVSEP